MTSRGLGMVGLGLALLVACALYAVKDRVQRLEGDLHQIRSTVLAERTALNRLRTEWALLNRPSRLAHLATTHLELVPAHPGQIARIEDLPFRADLELDDRQWPAVLPSGAEVPLRFKPADKLIGSGFLRPEQHTAQRMTP